MRKRPISVAERLSDAQRALSGLVEIGGWDGSTIRRAAALNAKCDRQSSDFDEGCGAKDILEALIACAGVAMNAAATVLDIPLKSAVVSAEGDVDLRGTLGVIEGAKVGFKEIRLRFDITSDAPQEKLDELLALTERYCVIYDTLRSSLGMNVRMNTAKS